jgi:hypothetical protein
MINRGTYATAATSGITACVFMVKSIIDTNLQTVKRDYSTPPEVLCDLDEAASGHKAILRLAFPYSDPEATA